MNRSPDPSSEPRIFAQPPVAGAGRSVCVYCASSTRLAPHWNALAYDVGRRLAQAGHRLVWGGGSVGMMGQVARGVHEHDGHVVGVIPQFMIDKELAYEASDELVVTQTMRQRKQVMEERADVFLVLPGGFGTLEEFFEILTLSILDCHAKPIVVLNDEGFYDGLLGFVEQLYQQQFANEKYRRCYEVATTAEAALALLTAAGRTDSRA